MPELHPHNHRAWHIWSVATKFDRSNGMGLGTITTNSILELCELYDATMEEFERIIEVEKEMYPKLAARIGANQEGKDGRN